MAPVTGHSQNHARRKGSRMTPSSKMKLYEWAEWIAKLVLVTICGLLWQMNIDLQRSLQTQVNQDKRITSLETSVETIKQAYVTRAEILETIKRVEMNQEIMMLRFKAEATKGRP